MDASAIRAMMAEIAPVIREYVAGETAPLVERCAALETRNAAIGAENEALVARVAELESREMPDISALCERGAVREVVAAALADLEPPAKGDPGEVDMEAVSALIDVAVTAAVDAIPVPEPGKNADIEDVREMVANAVTEQLTAVPQMISDATKAEVAEAVKPILEVVDAIPAPEKGDPGEVDMEAVAVIVVEKVAEAVAAIPPADKGDPGEVDMDVVAALISKAVDAIPAPQDGKSVDMEEVGQLVATAVDKAVSALPPPADGVGLASAFKDHEGCLILTMTNGATCNLGPIDGKDGETFTLDDFDIIPHENGRAFDFKFTRGDVCHSFEFSFPVVLDRGVWGEGKTYAVGDAVSWAGSLWIAQRDGPGKPDTADGGWRLSVKKGRDGKSAG